MKTLITTFLLMLAMAGFSQNQPLINGVETFGNWVPNTAGELPQYWDGFNREIIMNGVPVGVVTTITKDSADPKDSDFSVRLVSTSVMGGAAVPGMLTAGKMDIDFMNQTGDISGGIPYTQRPARFKGWYKYNPSGNDTALIAIWIKHDTLEIGGGEVKISNTTSGWTEFTVDINYSNNMTPDTINILFSSSSQRNNVPVGSALDIDHIWLEGGSLGFTRSFKVHTGFKLYPNPAKSYVKIIPELNTRVDYVNVYSSTGALVIHKAEFDREIALNTSQLSNGLYFVEIRSNNASIVEKLIIQ